MWEIGLENTWYTEAEGEVDTISTRDMTYTCYATDWHGSKRGAWVDLCGERGATEPRGPRAGSGEGGPAAPGDPALLPGTEMLIWPQNSPSPQGEYTYLHTTSIVRDITEPISTTGSITIS